MIVHGFRQPILSDISHIMTLERNCFSTPWSQNIFHEIISKKGIYQVDEFVTVFMIVIASEKRIVGYIVWDECSEYQHAHILNLAVASDQRNRGNGLSLLEFAFKHMKQSGIETCDLEVRESNKGARHLYEKVGMIAVDRSVGYYDDEDAIIYAIDF
ncbi:MAG: GNAT family N-acetyltransferase [Candidatus Thorarchaeota archaeon]|nr:GNAT family N-acetyltransferase [Candidatus Thorarchaeota archaeon]